MQGLTLLGNSLPLDSLLRGEPDRLRSWVEHLSAAAILRSILIIALGAGVYGGAMGSWRAPEQALLVALKFPLVILFTTIGNALLNAMLAPLLGLRASLRSLLAAVLLSFVIAATILGSFSPLVFFLAWNCPPMSQAAAGSEVIYSLMLLLNVGVIALAGVMANLRLAQLLQQLSGSAVIARRILFAWLAANLFLGSQVSWVLRPFIGSPQQPIQLVRPNAFQGNFYEAVFNSFKNVLEGKH
jgi:hypothetical protein